MIQVPISATDVEVLQEERYTHPYPRKSKHGRLHNAPRGPGGFFYEVFENGNL